MTPYKTNMHIAYEHHHQSKYFLPGWVHMHYALISGQLLWQIIRCQGVLALTRSMKIILCGRWRWKYQVWFNIKCLYGHPNALLHVEWAAQKKKTLCSRVHMINEVTRIFVPFPILWSHQQTQEHGPWQQNWLLFRWVYKAHQRCIAQNKPLLHFHSCVPSSKNSRVLLFTMKSILVLSLLLCNAFAGL